MTETTATGPLDFLRTASRAERRTLIASGLGWTLDGMSVTFYAMVIPALIREFSLTAAQAGLLASVTLIASAAGGVLFGMLADRAGRRPALIGSIAVYSIFTAACSLSQGVWSLAILRALLGLGMGGEWAAGAALVAEVWRPEHRGKALGLMQSGFAIGYALAAGVAAVILPRWGWRAVFGVGILPALLALWIMRNVDESPLWLKRHARTKSADNENTASGSAAAPTKATVVIAPPVAAHKPPSYAKLVFITLMMNTAAMFAWWGLFTWIPTYLAVSPERGGRGLTIAASSLWIFVMQAGMWSGYFSFGFFSDLVGRKAAYIGYLFVAAGLVPLYASAGATWTLLISGPLLAFFGSGHFTGFGIITAELFPTAFRASAMGLTFNFGRALSAAAPWAMGALATRFGFGAAFWMSGVAFLAAGLLGLAVPETRDRAMR